MFSGDVSWCMNSWGGHWENLWLKKWPKWMRYVESERNGVIGCFIINELLLDQNCWKEHCIPSSSLTSPQTVTYMHLLCGVMGCQFFKDRNSADVGGDAVRSWFWGCQRNASIVWCAHNIVFYWGTYCVWFMHCLVWFVCLHCMNVFLHVNCSWGLGRIMCFACACWLLASCPEPVWGKTSLWRS